jgi:hypothetical protein
MRAIFSLILFGLFSLELSAQMLMARGEMEVDGKINGDLRAGEESLWTFRFFNMKTDEQYKMFMDMHEKPMHLIAVKSDLSSFSHFHPYHDMMSGDFSIRVNHANTDPDNLMTESVAMTPGDYYLFSEVMPMGTGMMAMNRFQVSAYSARTILVPPDQNQLIPDLKLGQKMATRYLNQFGEPGREGDEFKVTLEMELFPWCDFYLPKFYFTLYRLSEEGDYNAIEDFQDWLGMGGHAVLISAFGDTLKDKVFYHLHAFQPIATAGEFTFPYHDHEKALPEGTYKIWGQFKTRDQILTVPFVFEYEEPELDDGMVFINCAY